MQRVVVIILTILLVGCSSEMDNQVDLLTVFDFENGTEHWKGGVSDYPVKYEDSIYFQPTSIGLDQLANSLPREGSAGLNISENNPHGDLFYFFNRKVAGLQHGKKYKLDFEFLIYTQLQSVPDKSSSNELYLKVGAVNYIPELEEVIWRNSEEYKALNLDKGDTNSEGGQDMLNVGSIIEFTSEVQEVISGNTFDRNFEIEPNKDGEIWILIGVDSGIKSELTFGLEALTVYYTKEN